MTWLAHQGHGFFGFNPDGSPRWCRDRKDEEGNRLPPLWVGELEMEEVMEQSADILTVFFKWLDLGVPPYTGGFLEAWPQRTADALSFCRQEWDVVIAHLRNLARKERGHG